MPTLNPECETRKDITSRTSEDDGDIGYNYMCVRVCHLHCIVQKSILVHEVTTHLQKCDIIVFLR
jgi:hypothetical protein